METDPTQETPATARRSGSQPQAQPQQLSRAQALWHLGWIKPMDILMALINVAAIFTLGSWAVFGDPVAINVLTVLFALSVTNQWWIVMLVLRGSDFVLSIRGEINLLPEAAARVAVAMLQGRGGK